MTDPKKDFLRSFVNNVKRSGEEAFIAELRRRISSQRLTQDQVAVITGQTRSAVSMWLNGDRSLALDAAIRLAEFFKINLVQRQDEGEEHA